MLLITLRRKVGPSLLLSTGVLRMNLDCEGYFERSPLEWCGLRTVPPLVQLNRVLRSEKILSYTRYCFAASAVVEVWFEVLWFSCPRGSKGPRLQWSKQFSLVCADQFDGERWYSHYENIHSLLCRRITATSPSYCTSQGFVPQRGFNFFVAELQLLSQSPFSHEPQASDLESYLGARITALNASKSVIIDWRTIQLTF